MESLQLDDVCRICLKHNVVLNWNEEMFSISDISYKDCYYKYTNLNEAETDPFPKSLCQICAGELKNAHLLFKKALESLKILQFALNDKQLENAKSYVEFSERQAEIKYQDQCLNYKFSNGTSSNADSHINDKVLIEIGEEMQQTTPNENTTVTIAEDVNNSKLPYNEANIPVHFVDIKNYESSEENLLKHKYVRHVDLKKDKLKLSDESFRKKECTKFKNLKLSTKLSTNKTNKQENINELVKTSLEQEVTGSCDMTSSKLSTSNMTGKIRKKYLLMCAYCSLKVDGTNQLKKHEATHSEDRKRTETCPQCGIKLYTKMALHNHMKIHDENRQKNYKCEFCEKAFFNRGALNVHRRIHLGLMVPCRICSKEFYRQIDLDKHLLKHSIVPVQKTIERLKYTVQCQYCNGYIPTNKWKEHKAAHLDQPQMKCKICDKNFFARSKCVSHIQRFHKKKKDYEDFIHYYVNCNTRMSHLILKQQEIVQSLKTPSLAE